MMRLALSGAIVLGCVACNGTVEFPDESDGAADDATSEKDGADAASASCATNAECAIAGLRCDLSSRTCVQCLAATDCTTPGIDRCDVTLHRCVQCVSMGDCSGGSCDPTTHRCVTTCAGGCSGETPTCDTARGICVKCRTAADCTSATEKRVCDPVDGRCVSCVADAECPPFAPRCDRLLGRCVQCVGQNDCSAGKICNVSIGACVAR